MELADLPTEILIKILQYLPTQDIAKKVCLVSKRMNVLSKDSSIGIALNFNSSTTVQKAEDIFKFRSRQVDSLFLNCAQVETLKVVIKKISSMSNIRKLEIWDDESKVLPIPKLFLKNLSNLKKLKRLAIQSRFEKSSLKKIVKFKNLKMLIVTPKYYDISEKDFSALANLGTRTRIFADFVFCTQNFNPQTTLAGSPFFSCDMTLKHQLVLRINSMPQLEMVLTHYPSVGTLLTYGDLQLDNHKDIRTLHSLLLSCKNLSSFTIRSSIFNWTIFNNVFSGWNFQYCKKSKNLTILCKPE